MRFPREGLLSQFGQPFNDQRAGWCPHHTPAEASNEQ